jgi:hypothetical protein
VNRHESLGFQEIRLVKISTTTGDVNAIKEVAYYDSLTVGVECIDMKTENCRMRQLPSEAMFFVFTALLCRHVSCVDFFLVI